MIVEELTEFVDSFIDIMELVRPNFDDAMKFLLTEIAEVYEIDLARKTWVRSHPENKPTFSKERLSEELGDVIMMAIAAGLAEDVDPVGSLMDKMSRKTNGRIFNR